MDLQAIKELIAKWRARGNDYINDPTYGPLAKADGATLLDCAGELEAVAARLQQGVPPVNAVVSEIRGGEENDGALDSTDLFIEGRGISLLVNVLAGHRFTYSLCVDRKQQDIGTVGLPGVPHEPEKGLGFMQISGLVSLAMKSARYEHNGHADVDGYGMRCGHFGQFGSCKHQNCTLVRVTIDYLLVRSSQPASDPLPIQGVPPPPEPASGPQQELK